MTSPKILSTARGLAEDVYFPSALATDASALLPIEHLDALAAAGFYGLTGPVGSGGQDADHQTICRAIEILAGGCLTTTFVWRQHLGVVTAVANASASSLRDRWLADLCSGRKRSGVSLAGALPGTPLLTAQRVTDGWLIDGRAPWVTGWGRIDVLLVAVRDIASNNIIRVIVDAVESKQVTPEPLRIVAVQASGTVHLRFSELFVPDAQVVAVEPHQEWSVLIPGQLRMNGSFALGVAGRCCTLLGPTGLDPQLATHRHALDVATEQTIATARAGASAFAVQAAAANVASSGSRSVLMDHHAQRLAREATFLLAFGQRPAIRAALLDDLGATSQLN